MDREQIIKDVQSILNELENPLNHTQDALSDVDDRVSDVERIIEDSSLEHYYLDDMETRLDDMDEKIFDCIEKVENVYSIDTQIDDDVNEVLNNIDNKLIKDISFILKDKILEQGVTRLTQVSQLQKEIRNKSWSVDKVATLDAKIDNLANVIDSLLNGKIRLVKPHNIFSKSIHKLSEKVRNIVRVCLAKVKRLNTRMLSRKAKDGIRVDSIKHEELNAKYKEMKESIEDMRNK